MRYRMGLMDDYRSERFITFSEASEILGIRSYSRVSKMVKAGTLAGFELVLESPFTDHPEVSGGAAARISVLIKILSCLL